MSRKNEAKVSSALGCQEAVSFETIDFEKALESLRADSEKPAETLSFEEQEALSKTPPKRFTHHALYSTKEEEKC